jgi:hypothetical protein
MIGNPRQLPAQHGHCGFRPGFHSSSGGFRHDFDRRSFRPGFEVFDRRFDGRSFRRDFKRSDRRFFDPRFMQPGFRGF